MDLREKSFADTVRDIAAEGVVLLENNGVLPLTEDRKRIALYGAGAVLTRKGGTGSGDVSVEHVTNIVEALEEAGFEITTKSWLSDYEERIEKSETERFDRMKAEAVATGDPLMSVFLRNPQILVDGAELPRFAEKIDDETAVYIISRISGECADREALPGDYFLTEREKEHLKALVENYEDVVVVLNTGGVLDTGFYREIEGLSAMIFISQAGVACGTVLADVLSGRAVPSGKLTSTWARNYSDYPASGSFRDNTGNDKFYEEGIYVGYRYFDSFGIEPAYAFGYGKSYTDFSWEVCGIKADEEEIRLIVDVTNTGSLHCGKEVLQVYTSSPAGSLDKPWQELRGFEKTELLAPGETQRVTIVWKTRSMASYCEEKAAYILEAGQYLVRLGNSSRNTEAVAAIELDETVVTERLRNRLAPCQALKECRPREYERETMEKAVPVYKIYAGNFKPAVEPYQESTKTASDKSYEKDCCTYEDVKAGAASPKTLVSQLAAEEMAALCVGAGAIGNGAVIGSAAIKVPGAAGETTSALYEKWKIPTAVLADGPAGLRLILRYQVRNADNSVVVPPTGFLALTGFERLSGKQPEEENCRYVEQKTTAIPIGSMMAQTWSPQAIRQVGQIVSAEMNQYGVHIWLAPAINIHRDPLCGRNFEYYSEDPLLAGICAAAMTRGIQSVPGCGVTVKHFAANSQEENRFDQNSVVSERALREIYLKGFEKVVKEADPLMLMTSYNLINGVHAANNRELLKDNLRTEWGFRGAVVTDWGTTRNGMRAGFGGKTRSLPEKCISSGNDLIMPGDVRDREEILSAIESGELSMEDLRTCAANLIRNLQRLCL